MFVDRIEIEVIAGKGGDGCMSFRREKWVPRGGPDGGDGGGGGSVIIEARDGVNNLNDFAGHRFWKAPKGTHGMGAKRTGRHGDDVYLFVPPGTTVIDGQQGFVIKDLVNIGDSFVAARGGKGGKGNSSFKSATNQAPRDRTLGEEGERRHLLLELKSIADVGLIGKPNAGKSTLLSRLSRARPDIANYPFTTKHPNLGQVRTSRDANFVLADIPGLIEGASEGLGLGHEFLRHVQRAGILVHLVEPEPSDQTDPIENYQSIRHELNEYAIERDGSSDAAGSTGLTARPEIIAVTKSELPSATEVHQRLREVTGKNVHLVSAVTGSGLQDLLHDIVNHLQKTDSKTSKPQDTTSAEPTRKKRTPPHLAGPTAALSDEVQAQDYVARDEAGE